MGTKNITIYSDGACEPNPGDGGWATYMLYDGKREVVYGGDTDTTNNRMELIGVLYGLIHIEREKLDCDSIQIVSDSTYVVKGINEWIYKWKKNGETKMNMDLWDAIWRYVLRYNGDGKKRLKAKWVRGHNGEEGNEIADQYACLGRLKYKERVEEKIERMAMRDKSIGRLNHYLK